MKEYKSENLRNIAVIGSSNVGKTCLGEAILFDTHVTNRQGKTDDKSSILDVDEDELEKQITISSHLYSIEYNGSKLNFIDSDF